MKATTLHRITGMIIATFVVMHLANHVMALAGPAAHIALMETLRKIYRHPVLEGILLLAVATQITTGVVQVRRTKARQLGTWQNIQRWSGLYLVFFFAIHLSAVFAGRNILGLDTNLYFGVAGMNTFPFNLFFVPYYALAVTSFFLHIASIHAKKMTTLILGLTPEQQARVIAAFGVVLTVVLLYGLTGGFRGLEIPDAYGVLIGK